MSAIRGETIGNITGDINETFDDMNMSYAKKVITPSINHVNTKLRVLGKKDLGEHKRVWIIEQTNVFDNIAWLLNSIDQRNNNASLSLIQILYGYAKDSPDDMDKYAFVELISDLLDLGKGVIVWDNIGSILINPKNQLIIMTKLTLVVEALLVVFQCEVQIPTEVLTFEATSPGYSSPEYQPSQSGESSESDSSPVRKTAVPIDETDDLSTSGLSQSSPMREMADFTDETDDLSTSGLSESSPIRKMDVPARDNSNKTSDNRSLIHGIPTDDPPYGNELSNPSSKAENSNKKSESSSRTQRSEKKSKKQEEDEKLAMDNLVNNTANRAIKEIYGDKLTTQRNNYLLNIAKPVALNVLKNIRIDLEDERNRSARQRAYEATLDALRENKLDEDASSQTSSGYTRELGGGSRKRKYTTRRSLSTRKRRPSKKPRRTIRRQRRNKKGTKKRRK